MTGGRRCFHQRQTDAHRGAVQIIGLGLDATAKPLDDRKTDRQTEAGATPGILGRIKRIKDVVAVLVGDAGAVIDELDRFSRPLGIKDDVTLVVVKVNSRSKVQGSRKI